MKKGMFLLLGFLMLATMGLVACAEDDESVSLADLKNTKYVTVWTKAQYGNDFGAGKVNIPITWSGTSFTGSYSGPSDRYNKEPMSLTVSGAVSNDGKSVLRLVYSDQTSIAGQGGTVMQVVKFDYTDIPFYQKAGSGAEMYVHYKVSDAECKSHIASLEVSNDSKVATFITPATVVNMRATFKMSNDTVN